MPHIIASLVDHKMRLTGTIDANEVDDTDEPHVSKPSRTLRNLAPDYQPPLHHICGEISLMKFTVIIHKIPNINDESIRALFHVKFQS